MSEDEARGWLADTLDPTAGQWSKLERFAALLREESDRQNLIGRSTLDSIWARHIVDSAQLIPLGAKSGASWLDIGSGAGLPGIVLGIMGCSVTLVEERGLRIGFLQALKDVLPCGSVQIFAGPLHKMPPTSFDIITARAVAPLAKLFAMSHGYSTPETTWLLPKGERAEEELVVVQTQWSGTFHVKPSVTGTRSGVVVASGIRPA